MERGKPKLYSFSRKIEGRIHSNLSYSFLDNCERFCIRAIVLSFSALTNMILIDDLNDVEIFSGCKKGVPLFFALAK